MARIKNTGRYPIKTNPNANDLVVISDQEDNGKARNITLESIVQLAVGGGVDTFATLNGNFITFPDGQVADITPVVDTDTNTFATLSGTVVTFADASVIDITQGNATINGNIITFGDGETRDITPVVDTDTDTFATLSGGTITFSDGQTIDIPAGGTDDQTAAEVSISPIAGLGAAQVQQALTELTGLIPSNTSDLTNDGSDGTNPFLSSVPLYTLNVDGTDLQLLAGSNVVSTIPFPATIDQNNVVRTIDLGNVTINGTEENTVVQAFNALSTSEKSVEEDEIILLKINIEEQQQT